VWGSGGQAWGPLTGIYLRIPFLSLKTFLFHKGKQAWATHPTCPPGQFWSCNEVMFIRTSVNLEVPCKPKGEIIIVFPLWGEASSFYEKHIPSLLWHKKNPYPPTHVSSLRPRGLLHLRTHLHDRCFLPAHLEPWIRGSFVAFLVSTRESFQQNIGLGVPDLL
jgi:hypothetical protein